MDISISKKDLVWNYVAQFFGIGVGLLTLPLILHKLSAEEIGMNYLMLSVSSLVALADFGFSDQFGRNLTYVFSGAKTLKKEGIIEINDNIGEIDYHLLSVVISTTRFIFRRVSIIVFFLMISMGTLYIYRATEGFTTVDHSIYIWLIFCVSTFFEMYFKYYNSLLVGSAKIMESKKSIILNRGTYFVLCIVLLMLGCGLFSVVISNLVAPFVGRWYSYKHFFTDSLNSFINAYNPSSKEIHDTFMILWFNAKKLGVNFIGSYGIQQSGTFIIGLFLSLGEVASYGLMCQLANILSGLSSGFFSTYLPVFARHRIQSEKDKLIKDYTFTQVVFFFCFIIGSLILICIGPKVISFISRSAQLPMTIVMFFYLFNLMLENYHSMAGSMIVTNNEVPFVKAGLITGFGIVILNFLSLQYTSLGLLGVVCGQLAVSSIYNHWKWPKWVLNDLHINFVEMFVIGIRESARRFNLYFK